MPEGVASTLVSSHLSALPSLCVCSLMQDGHNTSSLLPRNSATRVERELFLPTEASVFSLPDRLVSLPGPVAGVEYIDRLGMVSSLTSSL